MTVTPEAQPITTPSRRWPWGLKIAIAVAIAAAANAVLYVRDAVNGDAERLSRLKSLESRLADPVMLKLAGSRPWGVSRLAHRGRRSGRPYLTPLWATPVNEGFLITMPYGPDADWARNLLNIGDAVLRYQDVDFRVGNPRITSVAEARDDMPLAMRLLAETLGIQNAMHVDVLPGYVAEDVAPA